MVEAHTGHGECPSSGSYTAGAVQDEAAVADPVAVDRAPCHWQVGIRDVHHAPWDVAAVALRLAPRRADMTLAAQEW